jgi:uncharacterized coiled-coil protein SlyX
MSDKDDELLSALYQKSKQLNRSSAEQKRLFTVSIIKKSIGQFKTTWFYQVQFALSVAAISVLSLIVFNQFNPEPVNQYAQIDETVYHQVAIVERQADSLSWSVTAQKQSIDQTRDQQLVINAERFERNIQTINNTQQVALKVLNKYQDWHLETCDGEVLFKIKQDVVAELMGATNLFNDINTGQWLALTLNRNGHPQSLTKHNQKALCS